MLEDAEEFASDDLVEAARIASSRHPHLTAEIWWDGRKAAVVRPCWEHRSSDGLPEAEPVQLPKLEQR
jgi:hypothetical protein